MDLDANDEQLDCPFVYASAKTGTATTQLTVKGKDMTPLFDTIIEHIPAPQGDPDAGTQVLISTIDYNEYVGAASRSIRRSSLSTITIPIS